MTFQDSALILAWIAIILLTLGLVACVREIRLQALRVSRGYSPPRRLLPGDLLVAPAHLRVDPEVVTTILFVDNACRSCVDAVGVALQHVEAGDGPDVRVLWQGDGHPVTVELEPLGKSFNHQEALITELGVSLLPFAAAVQHDRVVASGHIGSRSSLDDLLRAAADSAVTDRHDMERRVS